MPPEHTRRVFLRTAVGLGVGMGLGADADLAAAVASETDRARGLPTAPNGKTGLRIPRIIMGLGSRFCTIADPEDSDRLLNHALDNGLFVWDTAAIYEDKKLKVVSEERVGRVLASRRREVFISTKVTDRTPDGARRQIETSLKRLGVSQLDQLMIHDVRSAADNAVICQKGGLIDIVHEMKAQKVTRHIGFTGHTQVDCMTELISRYDFDSVLVALNHYKPSNPPREHGVLPVARAKGMTVFVMKAVRPREQDKSLKPSELIRYALTLPQPHALILGMETLDTVKANLALLRNFEPLPAADMQRLAAAWDRFETRGMVPWHRAGYVDGQWA